MFADKRICASLRRNGTGSYASAWLGLPTSRQMHEPTAASTSIVDADLSFPKQRSSFRFVARLEALRAVSSVG